MLGRCTRARARSSLRFIPPEYVLYFAVGRGDQADALEELVRRGPLGLRDAVEGRLQPEVLPPGQQRVERGFLQRGADLRSHHRPVLDDVEPGNTRRPAGGGNSVVSMCTVVDLPAPFGPRKP